MQNLKHFFASQVLDSLQNMGLVVQDAVVSQSNRPDLSDYQSNVALPLAKKNGLNPRELATKIVEGLKENKNLYTASVDGPGFINFRLSDRMLAKEALSSPVFAPTGRKVVIDYGGPNIAKALHVGHLRSAVIGEAVKRIMRLYGDEVIGDVHFGDWGTPLGMLITEMQLENIPEDKVMTIQDISSLYIRAAASFKQDDDFKEKARNAVSELQSGNPKYRKIWQMFHDVSINDIKKTYDILQVDFDLWNGESDVNDVLPFLFDDLKRKGLAVLDDGAIIIRLPDLNGRSRAPFILRKTDGAYTYAATDLATIVQRVEQFNPSSILYVVDARQKEHFQQVFEVARMAGYVPEGTTLEHLAFGTVNGTDGKPFKTREGGVMSLSGLLDLALSKAREVLPEPSDEVSAEELELQAEQIALGAVKFQDLKSTRISDYVFDTENFTKSEGKTGAYVQYAVVRIKSILSKSKDRGFIASDNIVIHTSSERDLLLSLDQFPEVMDKAYELREPSEIANYAHLLAQKFSTFYADCDILGESDEEVRASRLKILEVTCAMLVRCLSLIGISSPDRMLRRDD